MGAGCAVCFPGRDPLDVAGLRAVPRVGSGGCEGRDIRHRHASQPAAHHLKGPIGECCLIRLCGIRHCLQNRWPWNQGAANRSILLWHNAVCDAGVWNGRDNHQPSCRCQSLLGERQAVFCLIAKSYSLHVLFELLNSRVVIQTSLPCRSMTTVRPCSQQERWWLMILRPLAENCDYPVICNGLQHCGRWHTAFRLA